MRRSLLAIGMITAVLAAGEVSAQAPVPPEVFAQRLQDAERAAFNAAAAPSPAAMNRVRASLALPVVVVFEDGDAVRIRDDAFLDSLRGIGSAEFRAAAAHLAAMRDALERAVVRRQPDRAAVADALRNAYRGVRAAPGWRERIVRAVIDWFGSVLDRLSNFSGPGSVIAWVVVAAVLAFVLWLLTRLRLVPERSVRDRGAEGPEDVDWHRLAREALARGDEPEAVRAHYRALLAALARRGVVSDSPSLTAGECRVSVGRFLPGAYTEIARATGVFERVAYGRNALASGDLDAMRRAEEVARAA